MNTNTDPPATNALLNGLQTVASKPCVVIVVPLCPPQNQLVSNSGTSESVVARTAPNQMSPNVPAQNGRVQSMQRQKPSVQNARAARMHMVYDRDTLELANTVFSLYNRWNAQQRTTDSSPSPAASHFGDVNQSVHSQSAIATPSSNAFADGQAVGNNTKMESGQFVVGGPSAEQLPGSTEQRGIKKEAIQPPPRPPRPPAPNASEKKLRCTMAGCGKTFKQRVDMRRHLNIHFNNGKFPCSDCDRRFVYQCYLTVHRRCHSKKESFECGVCHKRFARKQRLLSHLATTHRM